MPPGLKARNRISSCLNVVGSSTTRTPLESVHSVIPGALVAVFATEPGLGSVSMSGAVLTVSTYAVSAPAPAPLMTAASFASSGTVTPAFLGALTATTRLRSGTQSRGQAVDVGERDLRQEPLHEAVLVGDAGNRLLLHEVADELVGERLRRVLVVGGGELREGLEQAQAVAVQLGLREAEPRDAIGLGEERRESSSRRRRRRPAR